MQFTLLWRLAAAISLMSVVGLGSARLAEPPVADYRTALDEYVAAVDPHFEYTVAEVIDGDGYTGYIIRMTSQKWLTKAEVQEPIWWHWLLMAVPDSVQHETGLLFIGGGSNTDDPPTSIPGLITEAAVKTNSVVAEIRQIPNQPLHFVNDPHSPRGEDWQIAYTWDKFLRTGDTRWPSQLPMTKAAVRAMDTVAEVAAQPETGGHRLETFVVVGGSKRGWTAWTTAAVDPRVVAIVPAVIDLLNLELSFIHHFASLGFFAPAVGDYERMGIMQWIGTPENRVLTRLVEPFHYRHRFTMPKFIVNSTGDQFFLPDSSQFYFGDLIGEKFLRYVPNTDHSLGGSDAWKVMLAFYLAILTGTPRPSFSWIIEEDLSLRVVPKEAPQEVKLWQATNPRARDFRYEVIGATWESTTLSAEADGSFLARVPEPEEGWTAFMVELTYPGIGPFPLKFTTEVVVVPNVLPYLDRVPEVLPHAHNIDFEPEPFPRVRRAGPPN